MQIETNAKIHKGFKHVEHAVGLTMNPICHKYGFITHKLVTYWEKIVGKALATISTPLQISFATGKEVGGTLIIGVTNPGFSLELQAAEGVITERVAVYFGYKAISRVKIKIYKAPLHGILNKAAPQPSIQQQKYPKLMQALATLEGAAKTSKKRVRISIEDDVVIYNSIKQINDRQLESLLNELRDLMFCTRY